MIHLNEQFKEHSNVTIVKFGRGDILLTGFKGRDTKHGNTIVGIQLTNIEEGTIGRKIDPMIKPRPEAVLLFENVESLDTVARGLQISRKSFKTDVMETGIELIAEERREQIEKHGYTIESDIEHNANGQLLDAIRKILSVAPHQTAPPYRWDAAIWRKMTLKPYKERLAIAGAWAAAELDLKNSQ